MNGRDLMVWGETGGGIFVGPELAWQKRAACAETDEPDKFFPSGGAPSWERKKVCAGCPVRDDCLDWALVHDEQGIWGGLTEGERRKLLANPLPFLNVKEPK